MIWISIIPTSSLTKLIFVFRSYISLHHFQLNKDALIINKQLLADVSWPFKATKYILLFEKSFLKSLDRCTN